MYRITSETLEREEATRAVEEAPSTASLYNIVSRPRHYTSGEVECIDAIKSMCTREQYIGSLRATVVGYVWRYDKKNGVEDLKKAAWYLDRLIKEEEEKESKK